MPAQHSGLLREDAGVEVEPVELVEEGDERVAAEALLDGQDGGDVPRTLRAPRPRTGTLCELYTQLLNYK